MTLRVAFPLPPSRAGTRPLGTPKPMNGRDSLFPLPGFPKPLAGMCKPLNYGVNRSVSAFPYTTYNRALRGRRAGSVVCYPYPWRPKRAKYLGIIQSMIEITEALPMPRPRTKSAIVEDCWAIDVRDMLGLGAPIEALPAGHVAWDCAVTGHSIFLLHFNVAKHGEDRYCVTFTYNVTGPVRRHHISYSTLLESTHRRLRGRCWWLTCPIDVGGHACGARCCKLYLPPNQVIFGCRDCHDLTYESCRASHRHGRRT